MSEQVRYMSDVALLGRLSDDRREKFKAFMTALDAESEKRGSPYGDGSLWQTTGAECWFHFFEDDYSPLEAFEEDASCYD